MNNQEIDEEIDRLDREIKRELRILRCARWLDRLGIGWSLKQTNRIMDAIKSEVSDPVVDTMIYMCVFGSLLSAQAIAILLAVWFAFQIATFVPAH
jgi:hypothetical protein